MKHAVFQVCEAGGKAHLVCVEMASLQSAADFEHWLQMNIPDRTQVILLGRFESVTLVSNETDAERLILHRLGQAA